MPGDEGCRGSCAGKPLWGTLLALLHKGEPVLGLIDQPYTKERWVGIKGQPTTFNGAWLSFRITFFLPAKRLATLEA